MGRAVVRDPEHAPCGTVRLLAHDIVDQSAEGGLASLRFTAAKDHRTMDVPGCQVLQDASALVLVLEAHCLVRSDWQGRVAATTDLDAGFFIRAEHILVRPEGLALPPASVQVEHGTSHLQEVRITWKDPAPIAPRTQGIVCQQPPDGGARGCNFLGTQSVANFKSQFAQAVATERHVAIG